LDLSKHAILTNKRNATFDLHYSEFKYTTELSLWLGSFVIQDKGFTLFSTRGVSAEQNTPAALFPETKFAYRDVKSTDTNTCSELATRHAVVLYDACILWP